MDSRPLVVFIVDDDVPSRVIATLPFSEPGYQIHQFGDGASCLAAISEHTPDVILLDVEMPGLDGIATCRALRAAGETRAHVIFVSIHNDLDTRLRAYDAGGTDYIVKPVSPEELAQKVALARLALKQQRDLEEQAQQASRTAFTAMSSMGEFGVVLQFLRASFSCSTAGQLAAELIGTLKQYGQEGLVELHLPGQHLNASTQGPCSPLERAILAHAREMERVFQFHGRLVVNYPRVTLVLFKLPIDDEYQAGRIRDNLAILAEGAHARLEGLIGEAARQEQTQGIQHALADLSAALDMVEKQQEEHRLAALVAMDQYIQDLERAFVHLGLTETQEYAVSQMARDTTETVGKLLGDGKEISDRLHGVAVQLKQLVAA